MPVALTGWTTSSRLHYRVPLQLSSLIVNKEGVGPSNTTDFCIILFIMLTTTCFGRCGPSSSHKIVSQRKVSPLLTTLQSPAHGDHRTGNHRYQKWVLNKSSFSHLSLHSHIPNNYHLHSPPCSSDPVRTSRDPHITYIHLHRKTPTPHELFHLPGLGEKTHPHLYAESPATNYTRDNKSTTSRAEDKFHQIYKHSPKNFVYCSYK
jgi:hypothetical protein